MSNKKFNIITSNEEVAVLTSKTVSNKFILNAYNSYEYESGINSLILNLTSNEANISLYDEDTNINNKMIELNNNEININSNIWLRNSINSCNINLYGNLLITGNINDIKLEEINYLSGLTKNISNNFLETSNYLDLNEINKENTSNHLNLLDYKINSNLVETYNIIENSNINISNYILNIESKTSNIEVIENGNIKLNSDLEVSGLVTLNNLTLNDELIVKGHIITDRITILDIDNENIISSVSSGNSGDIRSFIGTYEYGANYKDNLDCSTYTVSSIVSLTKIYLNNFTSSNNNTIHKGDIILLEYTGGTIYRRAFEVDYTNNYITLYNDAETDVDTNITVSYISIRKSNYSLLFNDNGTYDNSSSHVVNNTSTVFNVPSNRIYNININVNYDLTHGTDFCKLYVKIKNNYVEEYIRRFTLQPTTMINNNYTASLNASFKIKLQKDDIITFETNYKLIEGYLDISGF